MRAFSGLSYCSGFSNTSLKWKGNRRRTTIGNDVWIGRNAVVRQGVIVGNGAIIGANSFVNKDVPPYAIVAGSPARVIRYRFPQPIRESLEELRWWDWIPPQGEHLRYDEPELFIKRFRELSSVGQLTPFEPVLHRVKKSAQGIELDVVSREETAIGRALGNAPKKP